MPNRIQRLRVKGWRMPEGVVYVGRPTRWGNPFWHTQRFHGVSAALALYRNAVVGMWDPSECDRWNIVNPDIPYEDQYKWRIRFGRHPLDELRAELRGKDLACWCRLDQPCHADILLELAN